jgi:branched-chain amino acid transport system substrate-binding protein
MRTQFLFVRIVLIILASVGISELFSRTSSAAEPIRIGFGISLTGPLAVNGKSALVAMKIWEEDINASGSLLGRPIKLVYYDDQSNSSTVPAIYTKLLDVDRTELIIGGYGTNMLAPAMPVVMHSDKLFIGLFGLAVNSEFKYPKYFSMVPLGPTPKTAGSNVFFGVAMAQSPKPKTIAITATDAEYSRNCSDGARETSKAVGLKVVYDRTYPPGTNDLSPIVRAIQGTNPDIVFVCSYPLDSVGMVRAVNEIGLKPMIIGGGMVGLQATALKMQLGPLLNGFVNYDFWLPAPTMNFPGVTDLLKKYQAKAATEGVDPLGYYIAPWAYAELQVLGQAMAATKSVDDNKLAEYIRNSEFKTVVGDVNFGLDGEWSQARILMVQFQNIHGNGLDQFRDVATQVILGPSQFKSGDIIYPYERAKH